MGISRCNASRVVILVECYEGGLVHHGKPLRLLNRYYPLLKHFALPSRLIHVMPQDKYAKRR